MSLKPVSIDQQAYVCPSWQEMGHLTITLAQKISKQKMQFDRVVALAKGGLGWNRQLQDILQIKNTSSIQVKFYTDINTTAKRPIVTQSLPVNIEDESILIFDDIADTGESLQLAQDYLRSHGAKQIATAAIFQKPWSQVKPDFVASSTEAWVIFPHDAIENIELLKAKWTGCSKKDFSERLHQLGLEPSLIDYYLAHY